MLQRYDSKKDCIVILCQNSDELKKFAGKILNCSDLSVIADQKNLFYCRDRISDPKIVYVYPPGGLVDESIVNKYLEQFEVEDDKITSIYEIDNANINITIIDKKNEIIEYREYEADNIMVKTVYDCKEKIEDDF